MKKTTVRKSERGLRVKCRAERVRDSLDELQTLAAKHPEWSAEALADAVELVEIVDSPAVELPDCYLCDNERMVESESGGYVRCLCLREAQKDAS